MKIIGNSRSIFFLLLLAFILVLIPACGTDEPEVTLVPVVEEPANDEEPVEQVIDGALPELVWSVPHDNTIHSIAVEPDGETIAVGEFKVTYIHLLADGSLIEVIVHDHTVEDLEFSPDGSIIGAGQGYHGIVLTNIFDGTELMTLQHGHNSRLAFSPDGVHLATGDRNGIIWLWRLDDGSQVSTLEAPEVAEKTLQNRWVVSIDYHPSGEFLASTHSDGTVYFWNIEEERIISTLKLNNDPFSFSPDGAVMAGAVSSDGKHLVRLWTVDGADQLTDLPDPGETLDLAFSPDSGLLAVASYGRPTVMNSQSATTIWDVSTGKLLYTLDHTFVDSDWPLVLTFTPDGGHLAVARYDGTLELWRLPGADPLVAPLRDMRKPPPLPSDVLFDFDSTELKLAAGAELEEFAEALYAEFPEAKITFIGHTDSRGGAAYNMQLSINRALAVKEWFENWAERNGVTGWALLVDGRGCTELRVPDTNVEGTFLEDAGSVNRRVEIEVVD